MDFQLTEEQQLLADMIDKFVADRYTFEKRRAILDSEAGWSRGLWEEMAGLGLLGVNVPEEHGGLGGGAVETMLVMEAFGRALVLEPYLASAVVAPALLKGASAEAQARLFPPLTAGETILAPALYERNARYELQAGRTRAQQNGQGYTLDGEKVAVIGGGVADGFIVSARVGAQDCGLFLVGREAAGLHVLGARAYDGSSIATIVLDGVKAAQDDVILASGALGIVETAVQRGVAAIAAEAVGAMSASIALTTDYLRQRKQFGKAIGSFQALQHSAVDMFVACEEGRSASVLAAGRAASTDERQRVKAIYAAKATIARSARLVGQKSIQLHGGIGMTDEYAASHYFKRLTAIEALFGDYDYAASRFAEA